MMGRWHYFTMLSSVFMLFLLCACGGDTDEGTHGSNDDAKTGEVTTPVPTDSDDSDNIEIAGTWKGTVQSGGDIQAVISNSTMVIDVEIGTINEHQEADVEWYRNEEDYAVVKWTQHSFWTGQYTKIGWVFNNDGSVTMGPYKPHDTAEAASAETEYDTQGLPATFVKQ